MSYGSVLYYFGLLMLALAGLSALPLSVAVALGETAQIEGFLGTMIITGFAGGAGVLGLRGEAERDTTREWFLLPVMAWTLLPVFAALPFSYGDVTVGLTDAYFEAVSGLTTTGTTMLRDLDSAPASILLWRALLQWVGGLATVVLAVTLLSLLGVGGMQVFRSSIPRGESGSMFSRMKHLMGAIWPVYLGLTAACTFALWAGGMPFFDAVCHGMSTLSTGGFSTRDGSIGTFDSPLIEGILLIFMIVGALNFTLHTTMLRDVGRHYREDPELRQFVRVAVVGALVLGLGMFILSESSGRPGLLSALWSGLFSAVSVLSTTGYVNDIQLPLPLMPALAVFALMMIGASTGSTGGGLKLMRFTLLIGQSQRELARLAHPHSVVRVRFGERVVPDEIMAAIWAFFVIYIFCVALATMALGMTGLGFDQALALAASAVSNSGPAAGLISSVDPIELSVNAKWVLCGAMLLGRLEILPLLTLINLNYWRD
jgi:trk system potassium uptake protein